MSKQEYTLHLTHAPNGGWVIMEYGDPHMMQKIVAAYSNKSHMLNGLSDMIDEIAGKDE